jgi:hypothetical protein
MFFKRQVFIAATFSLIGHSALAEDIQEGTVLQAENYEALKNKTFEGKKIADMLVDTQKTVIQQFNWKMKLRHNEKLPPRTGLVELTEKFKGQATIDPHTRKLQNFTTGVPFPEIDSKDPLGGIKIAYNFMRSAWSSDVAVYSPEHMLTFNGKRGMEREMTFHWQRLQATGRVKQPYTLGDGTIAKYETGVVLSPNDLRGVGTLTIQYSDGRLPDVYAYLKMVRRVRRLSSSAWGDPLSGTDFLTDETFAMNADPTWYQNWKVLGKQWILAVAHSSIKGYQQNGSTQAERYPDILLNEAPYWNVMDTWEPREVWVVESNPPTTHLLSKKVQYYDADPYAPLLHWQNFYDRSGKIWRIENTNYAPVKDSSGGTSQMMLWVSGIDLQRVHATLIYYDPNWRQNMPDVNISDYTPEGLSRILK